MNYERASVRVEVFSDEGSAKLEKVPRSLVEFSAWIQTVVAEVPAEYRASAIVEIEGSGDYDYGHEVEFTVSYKRPETDAEWRDRVQDWVERNIRHAQYIEEQERAALAKLKAKYEAAR